MHGNVSEWWWDWYDQYDFVDPSGAVVTLTDPEGPTVAPEGGLKVARGGSAVDPPRTAGRQNA